MNIQNRLHEKEQLGYNRSFLEKVVQLGLEQDNSNFKASKIVCPDTAYDFTTDFTFEIRQFLEKVAENNSTHEVTTSVVAEEILKSSLFSELNIPKKDIVLYLEYRGDELPLYKDTLIRIALAWYAIDLVAKTIDY